MEEPPQVNRNANNNDNGDHQFEEQQQLEAYVDDNDKPEEPANDHNDDDHDDDLDEIPVRPQRLYRRPPARYEHHEVPHDILRDQEHPRMQRPRLRARRRRQQQRVKNVQQQNLKNPEPERAILQRPNRDLRIFLERVDDGNNIPEGRIDDANDIAINLQEEDIMVINEQEVEEEEENMNNVQNEVSSDSYSICSDGPIDDNLW